MKAHDLFDCISKEHLLKNLRELLIDYSLKNAFLVELSAYSNGIYGNDPEGMAKFVSSMVDGMTTSAAKLSDVFMDLEMLTNYIEELEVLPISQ